MENGDIKSSFLRYSSKAHPKYHARLNAPYGGWANICGVKPSFIQVYLGPAGKVVTAIATQIKDAKQYLISYTISYSIEGLDWANYRENGEVKVGWLKSYSLVIQRTLQR